MSSSPEEYASLPSTPNGRRPPERNEWNTREETKRHICSLLRSSQTVMALVGAGLSSPSGVPTFRNEGALWRGHDSVSMAKRSTFMQDPALVWQFYENRRHMALEAFPNSGHLALVQLANSKPKFLMITQNIDELSERAGHPPTKLAALHGSLFTVRCSNEDCHYTAHNIEKRPIVPGLELPSGDLANPCIEIPVLDRKDLPHCPKCRSIVRPGVVLFGEQLPLDTLRSIDSWLESVERVDLMLVVGTTARVAPASEYILEAKERGAIIVELNISEDEELFEADFVWTGDVSRTLPELVDAALPLDAA